MHIFNFRVAASARAFRAGAGTWFPFAPDNSTRIGTPWANHVNAGVLMEGSEKYVFPADHKIGGVLKAKAGDIWLHVELLDEVDVVDGWVAVRHMGVDVAPLNENPVLDFKPMALGLTFQTENGFKLYSVHPDTHVRTLLLEGGAGILQIDMGVTVAGADPLSGQPLNFIRPT